MEKGLGELGFWLAVGIVFAAMIIAGAIKKPDPNKESWKDQFAMDTGGKTSIGQVVAFMMAFMAICFALLGGIIAQGQANMHGAPWQTSLSLMFVIWAGGFIVGGLIWYFALRNRSNGPPPGA